MQQLCLNESKDISTSRNWILVGFQSEKRPQIKHKYSRKFDPSIGKACFLCLVHDVNIENVSFRVKTVFCFLFYLRWRRREDEMMFVLFLNKTRTSESKFSLVWRKKRWENSWGESRKVLREIFNKFYTKVLNFSRRFVESSKRLASMNDW